MNGMTAVYLVRAVALFDISEDREGFYHNWCFVTNVIFSREGLYAAHDTTVYLVKGGILYETRSLVSVLRINVYAIYKFTQMSRT